MDLCISAIYTFMMSAVLSAAFTEGKFEWQSYSPEAHGLDGAKEGKALYNGIVLPDK